jgi:hypothetical protein
MSGWCPSASASGRAHHERESIGEVLELEPALDAAPFLEQRPVRNLALQGYCLIVT